MRQTLARTGKECIVAGHRPWGRFRLGLGAAFAGIAVLAAGCTWPGASAAPVGAAAGAGGASATASASASAAGSARAASAPSVSSPGSPRGAATADGARRPLAGKVVGVDPGHNGGNFTHLAYIDRMIWNGREWETCNTTGTATDGGYTEALFNFRVASYLKADLIAAGARVVLTRTSNDGVGPCVNQRAAIINTAHANVGLAIHADGAASSGRGFAILEPVADGPNDPVITASAKFGSDVRTALLAGTPMPPSNYDGINGIKDRDDLGGLNLTHVPMVLVEVGNMRNATDATLLTSPAFQQEIARALVTATIQFLR